MTVSAGGGKVTLITDTLPYITAPVNMDHVGCGTLTGLLYIIHNNLLPRIKSAHMNETELFLMTMTHFLKDSRVITVFMEALNQLLCFVSGKSIFWLAEQSTNDGVITHMRKAPATHMTPVISVTLAGARSNLCPAPRTTPVSLYSVGVGV